MFTTFLWPHCLLVSIYFIITYISPCWDALWVGNGVVYTELRVTSGLRVIVSLFFSTDESNLLQTFTEGWQNK